MTVGRPSGTFSQRSGGILQRLMRFSDFASFYVPTYCGFRESMANPLSFVFGIPCMLEACNLNGCKN